MFLQQLRLTTSNLVCSLGLPRPIIKSHPEEKFDAKPRGVAKFRECESRDTRAGEKRNEDETEGSSIWTT